MRKIAILLLALLPSVARAEDSLGRLFFTPAQRATLDAGKELEKPKGTARVVRGPRAFTVNGIVTRSDGGTAVWINGHEAGGKTVPGVRASASAADPTSTQIRVGGAGKSVRLRVGQQLDRVSGKVLEPYESAASGAAAVVHSPKKKLVREDRPPAAARPDKASAADDDEPSSE